MKADFKPISKWIPNLKRPLVIAGPCSAESEEQMLSTARELVQIEDVRVFRAGIWKPRTRPGTFEGVGEVGLEWLKKVKEETGLLITTEVANAQHAELCLKAGVDILWIGARTTVNPFSVQEIADALKGTNIPVMVKNPINADLALWMGAIERMYGAGLDKIVAIHRGFSNFEKTVYRNCPIWRIPIELKRRLPDLPLICDPSHIAGKRDLIFRVCQKAMDTDMDGLMVETHIDPSVALSDASQQVTPERLHQIIKELDVRAEFSADRTFEDELRELRYQIDRIDHDILETLSMRNETVSKIAEIKQKNKVTPFQRARMAELLEKRILQGSEYGLRKDHVREVYNLIHEESVKTQTDIMNKTKVDYTKRSED